MILSSLLNVLAVVILSATTASPIGVTITPPYFDEWCSENCSSWETCNGLFREYFKDFVDLRLRVKFPIDEGPGRHLIPDKYFGSTISRQSFETQFVLDIASALETSPCRLYVISVSPEGTDNYWDSESVFVTFRLFPADAAFTATLTQMIQNLTSPFYEGHITHAADPLYGLVALQWDYSVKLMYSISIVGDDGVVDSENGRYLNQGSLQSCAAQPPTEPISSYCEFEAHVTNDMEMALGLQSGQFVVLFIKEADLHSVIVSFRLVPHRSADKHVQDSVWVQSRVSELLMQMSDYDSPLYAGNVTYKIDPTWANMPREFSQYLSRPIPSSSTDAYERCKATHRCPRASIQYNQSSAHSIYTYQKHLGGEHIEVPLFLDFEDWRKGIRGWGQSCRSDITKLCLPASALLKESQKPVGSHWSPFEFEALGPDVPTTYGRRNSGLVLNKKAMDLDVKDQSNLIREYETLVEWMKREFQQGITGDPKLRSRQQIIQNITNYTDTISAEKEILEALEQSQCANVQCDLIFNTSDASLRGAVNATGVITKTLDGTEVALWAFDSINIDENVNITLTGQRAMALASRSSILINTTLNAIPGTLGGFPGGYSVSRRPNERLVRVCNEEVDSREFLDLCKGNSPCCPGDQPISELGKGVKSNNVNGPGSPSARVYLMTIKTTAPIVNEIQSVTTSAGRGQTLSGGFFLHFNGFSTTRLPHDITASELKRKIEDSLNPVKRNQLKRFDRTESSAGIGVVEVTREVFGSNGGYRWDITFTSAVGNIGKDSSPLTATNKLVSKGAKVEIETVRHGNSIGGKFALKFLGTETRLLRHDVSASELEEALLQDITSLSTAHVLRSDAGGNCNDGFCDNGSDRSGGYVWTLTLTTQVGNTSPFSPTSVEFDDEGEISNMTALNRLTGCANSLCPSIQIDMGHSKSHNREMRSVFGKKPFSLAYGGAGGGYGGNGGAGYGGIGGRQYGDERISDSLYGGSGGGVGVKQPFQLGIFKDPRGRGGSGGGAIEIIAANDIIIGSNAVISCNGEPGASGYMSAGGGGSGGTILLASGGTVQIDGKLYAMGGDGGEKKSSIPNKFGGHGGSGSGGRMALYAASIILGKASVSLHGGKCSSTETSQSCRGEDGTLFVAPELDSELTVDQTMGAEGTGSSLLLLPRIDRPPFNPGKLISSTKSGPEYDLGKSVRPNRISFHFRVEDPSNLGWNSIFALFELRDSKWSSIVSAKADLHHTAIVGIAIGKGMKHGTNYIGAPFDDEQLKMLSPIKSTVEEKSWTKVDIRFDWRNRIHDVYVNDTRLVEQSPFIGEGVRAISLGNFYEGGSVWFDEIYVGEDTTMAFHCPVVLSDGTLKQMDRPLQKGWKAEDLGELSSLRPMQRHESHVSDRAVYQRADHKYVVPFDGQGENGFTSDVKFRSSDGDRLHEKGEFLAGMLLRLPRAELWNVNATYGWNVESSDGKHGMQPDTFLWYGEHDYFTDPRLISSAVMACSTQDFKSWKNEGVMLSNLNLTDMVSVAAGPLRAEKPKVLFNNMTKKYVMWFLVDNGIRELGMAGVAVSDYANGPFEFVRTLYPDGNKTRDFTLFQDDGGTAYLMRTYYSSASYVLPEAIMQPTWESVKNADGSTNYALSFHRAEYEPGYDDYHDIYLQRWRTEDKPWKVICVNRLTHQEREVPFGKEHLNFDGEACQDPFEYKRVLGQGNPMYESSKDGIQSRFLDPNNPDNNAWVPSSVPSIKGQVWKENYKGAGTCGKRKINDDIQPFDPSLPIRDQPDREGCSNIADNPIHSTLPDKRIGPETVVERRRAKYVAVSRLADDYLDTRGYIKTFEGELDGADLLSLVRQYNKESDLFRWTEDQQATKQDGSASEEIGTTFQPRIQDNQFSQAKPHGRFPHGGGENAQYRSFYSPACIYSGECPIDFSVHDQNKSKLVVET